MEELLTQEIGSHKAAYDKVMRQEVKYRHAH